MVDIVEAQDYHFDDIWTIFQSVVSVGDTYAYPVDTNKEQAHDIWVQQPEKTYVAVQADRVIGTYYLKTNHFGPGDHVCNCGYMVSSAARGLGVATAMCKHSQLQAIEYGYKAMQFNFVTESNSAAVHLWQKLGYHTVGRLPKAFNHPQLGMKDALVMYKWLGE